MRKDPKIKKAILIYYVLSDKRIFSHLIVGTLSHRLGLQAVKKHQKNKIAKFTSYKQFKGELVIDQQKGEVYYLHHPATKTYFSLINEL